MNILFQDQWLVVVDKPAGMLVHPGRDPEPDSEIAMKVLRDQIGMHVRSIHRLDRPTSGNLVFALDRDVEIDLRGQFARQEVTKVYTAVVLGHQEGDWISRDLLQKSETEPFREAETRFNIERHCKIGEDAFSVLSVTPVTGRFHQIRKHLALAGTPIVGDFLYGDIETMERIGKMIEQPRLMLHSTKLTFFHPIGKKEITVESGLPERFGPFEAGA